ncbi:MAG: TatD family hydrolase [Ruminococcus sp.]|nr:TatD family hydrolase [Ruminococcus sp.]
MNGIFDTHAHYADDAFNDDRKKLLETLPSQGIELVMLASSGIDDTKMNSKLAAQYGYIYAAAGVHPENENNFPENYLDMIRDTVKNNPKIKAVGEIGLDYHYEGYDRDRQIMLFTQQLELAQELDLPVIIHSRDAWDDTMDILKKYRPRGVVHCFSGSAEIAAEILKLGMYIGFTGVLTFKNAKKAIRALEVIPADRLLLETDCPYMAPVPFRGKRCDSSMILYTAEKMAEIKRVSTQEMIDIVCVNGKKLFDIS